MNVSRISLSTIPEHRVEINPESQHGRIEGSWHNTDIPTAIHAARMEHTLRSSPIAMGQSAQEQPIAQPPQERAQPQSENRFKTFCNTMANLCGIAVLPSIACIAFGVIGLVVPGALVVACVVFALLAGKPTEREQARREERHSASANFDYRGSV